MTNDIAITDDTLLSKILYLRGQNVMTDHDLAELYGVTTKTPEQVKRNSKRFSPDFMFHLNKEEKDKVVAFCDHLKTLKYSTALPYAFTEHGAVMPAGVLNSERAISVNVRMVRLFNTMQELVRSNQDILLQIEQLGRQVQHQGDLISAE